jgi:hypothetical protein
VSKHLISLVLVVAGSLSQECLAQEMTPADAKNRAYDAGRQVFEASAAIFTCLSEGRNLKDVSYRIGNAQDALSKARAAYDEILKAREKAIFLPGDYSQQASSINSNISSSDKKVGVIRTEGDVALANIIAIDRLVAQVGKWKNCSPSTVGPREMLSFIENKIFLERTTQLAEIAWIQIRRTK